MSNGFTVHGFGQVADNGESIDSRHPDYISMIPKYQLINALKGGSAGMARHPEYLPRFPKEENDVYARRVDKAFLDPSFSVAIESHTSKPFSHEIVVENASDDPRVAELEVNADGEGNSLTEFGKRLFADGDEYGKSYVLVDFTNSEAINLQQELASGARATFVHIKCLDLFYWDNDRNGLTEIRYWRDATVPHGQFGKKQVRQIVRWTRDQWQVWQETLASPDSRAKDVQALNQERMDEQEDQWSIVDSGANTLGIVPLIPMYFKRTGFMKAEPPNYELAEVNLQHYQDMSDQRRLEEMARVGIMFAAGFDPDELENFTISANFLASSENTEAKLSVVEHSGAAVKVGRDSLKVLEDKMEELSLKPEINRTSGDVTAAEVTSNSFNSCSDLLNWTRAVEDCLKHAYMLAYSYIGQELPEDFKLKVYDDFVVIGNTSDLGFLLDAKREGVLDQKTLLFEMKRRGSIDIQHSIKDIMEKSQEEAERKADMAMKVSQASAQPQGESNAESDSNSSTSESDSVQDS